MSCHRQPNAGHLAVNIRKDLEVGDAERRYLAQLHLAHDAVPVALGLVSHGMGVLTHVHRLQPVVDADGEGVHAWLKQLGHIVFVSYTQAAVAPCLTAVHVERGLDVRTLQRQDVALLFLVQSCQFHLFPVPCHTHIVLVGREEERQLHLAGLAVALKIGIEKIGAVVERTHPFRVNADVVTFQALGHRGGQFDAVAQFAVGPLLTLTHILAVNLKLPLAGKVHRALGTDHAAKGKKA